MLRNSLIVIMAVAVSFGFTALAGYLVYATSAGSREANLSIVVRFAINPMIGILIGALAGRLSKDHPVSVAALGLAPWTMMLLASPQKPTSPLGWAIWLFPVVICLPLSAAAALCIWRYTHQNSKRLGSLASPLHSS